MSRPTVPEINVVEGNRLLGGPNPPRLIDVRERDEWDTARIPGAELLPLSQWPAIVSGSLTDKAQPLIIHCHHGGRSARATEWLLGQGFTSVTNLAGGIDAWSIEIDPSIPRYQ
jgi:rhodanese-related sulfurtransferase